MPSFPFFSLLLHRIFNKMYLSPTCCFLSTSLESERQDSVPSSCPRGADLVVGGVAAETHRETPRYEDERLFWSRHCWPLCRTHKGLTSPALLTPFCWFFGEPFPERSLVSVSFRVWLLVSLPRGVELGCFQGLWAAIRIPALPLAGCVTLASHGSFLWLVVCICEMKVVIVLPRDADLRTK